MKTTNLPIPSVSLKGFPLSAAALLLALWLPAIAPAAEPLTLQKRVEGQHAPVVLAISFVGNEITKPVIMRQEMGLQVGDEATTDAVEAARQAVMDLGLFKSVEAELLPADDMIAALKSEGSFAGQYGGEFCKLRITVEEKWYILPIPRLSLNADGESSYGVRVRWNNIGGLNQRLSLLARQSTNAEDDRGDSNKLSLDYSYPLAMQTPFNFSVGGSIEQTATDELLIVGGETKADETQLRANISLSRSLAFNSRGWSVGAGLAYWRLRFSAFDDGITDDDLIRGGGNAPSFRLVFGNNQVRDYAFSRGGWRFNGSLEQSIPSSGFDFWKMNFNGAKFVQLGSQDRHQRLILRGELGAFHGGPRAWTEHSIGGSSNNRGFGAGIADGNLTYYLGAEYLRPLFGNNAVRGLLLLDVSQVFSEVDRVKLADPLVSVGFGIRWRVQSFVDLEIDIALAYAINDNKFKVTGGSNKGD